MPVRLIDANALIEFFENLIEKSILEYTKIHYTLAIETVKAQPTIEADIDRAAILRMCNDIADEVTDIAFNSTHYYIRDCCEAIRKYLEEIGKELGDAGTD